MNIKDIALHVILYIRRIFVITAAATNRAMYDPDIAFNCAVVQKCAGLNDGLSEMKHHCYNLNSYLSDRRCRVDAHSAIHRRCMQSMADDALRIRPTLLRCHLATTQRSFIKDRIDSGAGVAGKKTFKPLFNVTKGPDSVLLDVFRLK